MIVELVDSEALQKSKGGFPDGSAMLLRQFEVEGREADVVVDESGAELVSADFSEGWVFERAFASQEEAREFLESLPSDFTDPGSLGFRPLKPR